MATRLIGHAMMMIAIATLAACGGAPAPSAPADKVFFPIGPGPGTDIPAYPTGPFVVGATYTDPDAYVEYQPGEAPLVIIAPHGGTLAPASLPDRACAGCVTLNDANTQALARLVVDSFTARTGRRPHLVVNRLQRRKFDANRDRAEATDGNVGLYRTWTWFHAFIDTARAALTRSPGRGLVIDLHGHAHAIARVELGYDVTATTLRLNDSTLSAMDVTEESSIAAVARAARAGEPGVALLNGPNSLGGLLAAAGVSAVPSDADRAPGVGEDYFNGGYNTERHGSRSGGTVDAIQVECYNAGIRDTAANRERFAGILAAALAQFLDQHYDWR